MVGVPLFNSVPILSSRCQPLPAAARHQFRLKHQEEPGLSRVTTARFLPLLLLAELFIGSGRLKSHLQRRKEEKFYFRKK